MSLNTKLVFILQNYYQYITKKFTYFKIYFANSIFFLFFGFLIGNLFGSLLNIFQKYISWNGLITIFILIIIELINCLIYQKKNRVTIFSKLKKLYFAKAKKILKDLFIYTKFMNIINTLNIFIKCLQPDFSTYKHRFGKIEKDSVLKSLNLFKIGILLGFFIDAFKVGS